MFCIDCGADRSQAEYGARVYAWRMRHRVPLHVVARKVGITAVALSRLERVGSDPGVAARRKLTRLMNAADQTGT